MDTALSITQTLGRPLKSVSVEIIRDLTEADLLTLGEDRGVKPTALKRLTNMHHAIARLVAQGEAGYAIAMATGYSESRISILKSDPAFQELVAQKALEVEAVRIDSYSEMQNKLAAFGSDIVEIYHDRVLEEAETMSLRDINEAGRFVLDRAGFGPASKSTNTNINLDLAEQLEAGRLRAIVANAAVPAAKAGKEMVASPFPASGEGPSGPGVGLEDRHTMVDRPTILGAKRDE